MAPAIAARSEEIEALRRLPADLVAELRAAGFFRMGRSRAKGGPQMTLPQHLEVIEVLAHADPSVGWCVKIGTDSGLIAEFLPAEASARLLPHPDRSRRAVHRRARQARARRGRLSAHGPLPVRQRCRPCRRGDERRRRNRERRAGDGVRRSREPASRSAAATSW
jgi:hypothetical protein